MKLADLTVTEFVAIMCDEKGRMSPEKRRDLFLEYEGICNPGEVKKFLTHGKKLANAQATLLVYTVCDIMLKNGDIEDAKDVLDEMKVRTSNMTEERLKAEVSSRLARTRKQIKELEDGDEVKEQTPAELRKMFDRQTAMLMSYFKFQIDCDTMKATQYAYLIAQMDAQLKAQQASLDKLNRRR